VPQKVPSHSQTNSEISRKVSSNRMTQINPTLYSKLHLPFPTPPSYGTHLSVTSIVNFNYDEVKDASTFQVAIVQ
jgi:hypothetical protein